MIRHWSEYMLDIETLGKSSRAAIVQIGVCGFDFVSGEIGTPLTMWTRPWPTAEIDYDTIRWWMNQGNAAREAVFGPHAGNLSSSLELLDGFFPLMPEHPYRVWAMPPEFDITILKSAYEMCGRAVPWAYNATRDLRTLEHLAGCGKQDRVPAAVQHDAGQDAIAQALTAIKYWRKVGL